MAPGKVGLCRDGDARGSCKGKGRLAEWLGSSTRPQAPSLASRTSLDGTDPEEMPSGSTINSMRQKWKLRHPEAVPC